MPVQSLSVLKVNATGLLAADTAVLAGAKQLTSLDLSSNPCLSEGCMQHLHGERGFWGTWSMPDQRERASDTPDTRHVCCRLHGGLAAPSR